MSKMLLMTTIALAALAMTAMPTASACQWIGPGDQYLNYATCNGGAAHDAISAVGFAQQEAGDAIAFVQSTEAYGLLP